MNTIAAFAMGEAYRGSELKVFDWDKAAKLIKESKTDYALEEQFIEIINQSWMIIHI